MLKTIDIERKIMSNIKFQNTVVKFDINTAFPDKGRFTPTAYLGLKSMGAIFTAPKGIIYSLRP